jgi:hypothetical protein
MFIKHVLFLDTSMYRYNRKKSVSYDTCTSTFKGIFQPFELGGETILIRSAVKH